MKEVIVILDSFPGRDREEETRMHEYTWVIFEKNGYW
jgi:hypothetical protein